MHLTDNFRNNVNISIIGDVSRADERFLFPDLEIQKILYIQQSTVNHMFFATTADIY